jgi:trimeric autotransporter adhesin
LAEANPVTGAALGNYSLAVGSPAIDYIPTTASTYGAAPSTDFFGNPRPDVRRTAIDVGAVEFQHASTALAFVTPTELDFGAVDVGTPSAAQTLTVNAGGAALTGGITVAFPVGSPFSRTGGTCGVGNLAAGATCTITVVFTPTTAVAATSTVTITSSRTIDGSPVTLTGTGQIATLTASVTPSPLAFGNSATGAASAAQTLTVTNTGNSALAGGSFTFGAATPFTRAGGTCGGTLAIGATCTINVVFTPATSIAYTGSLAVAYTGATVTGSPVMLSGTGVAAASVSLAPNPLTITIATPLGNAGSGTGSVTFTNTAAAGGASVTVTAVGVASGTGSGLFTWIFNKVLGTGVGADTCTGKTLAPAASCTVGVRFTNVSSPVGVNRAGTITFTDTGAGGSQTGALVGHANPSRG